MKKKPTGNEFSSAKKDDKPERLSDKKDFLVVGLGASAGGIKALQEFFATMPPDSGMAFVAILHLSPEHESSLAQILQAQTSMKVTQVTKTVKVEPNNVYVIPPNQQLEMVDGVIRPKEVVRPLGHRIAIDVFFRTLAEAYERNAVCVVLSGTGADGTSGLKRVKESNGFAIVQDPEDAQYDSMPRSAINTQLADWVLPVHQMPEKLIHFKQSSERLHLTNGADAKKVAEEINADDSLREVLTLLRVRTGHDFSNYKMPTLVRRIARHLQIHELEDIPSYLELLRNQPNEIQSLLKNLLINVTNFFRDRDAFGAVESEIVPNLFAGKTGKDTVRVWSAGCASGEEAFSLGILLTEYSDKISDPPKIQIFASDVDDEAIAEAREHRYPEAIEADVSPERLKRFFTKEGSFYRVKKELREMVLFAPHNILRDPPFSRLDLIVCRNLLIYLNRETQEKVLQIFHFALNSSGYLFLGSSETAENLATLFSPVEKKHRIYSRRNAPVAQHSLPVMPVIGRWDVRLPERKIEKLRDQALTLSDIHYRLLENYAPSSVLVNQDFDIVYLSGTANRFLRFMGGEPSRNLLKAVVPDLLPDLRAALFSAQRDHRSSEFPNIRVRINGEETTINLIVRTVEANDEVSDFLLVIFEEKNSPAVQKEADREIKKIADKDEAMETVVRRLEEDLQRTKEHLRSTIEQHETTVEELKASNEELQAINEELRSASEELETSKEELQSVNEELTTVNHELKDKIDETSRINSDLSNLMAATDIATIFLDKQLKIKRYTPPVEEIFNITPADIGRPLEHFTHRLHYENLSADAEKALRLLTTIEREITDDKNHSYLSRFAPYRTIDDRIDGVVLNFIDITDRRIAEQSVRESEERLQKAINIETVGVIFFNNDFEITDCNEAFLRLSGYSRKELQSNRFSWESFTPDNFAEVSSRAIEELNANGISTPYEKEYFRKDGSRFWAMFAAKRIGENEIVEFLTDITEQKRAEETLRASEERQAFLLKLSDWLRPLSDAVQIVEMVTRETMNYLKTDRCYYCEVEGETVIIRRDAHRKGLPSVVNIYSLSETPLFKASLKNGQPVAVADVETSEKIDDSLKEICLSLGIVAYINVPVFKNKRLVGLFCLTQTEIKNWTNAELELAKEIAERTWATIERARTEEALAASEEKYRTLFDSIDEGVATMELIFDDEGRVADWLYVDHNPALARLTGISENIVGQKASDIYRNLEPFWMETFERVVREGISRRVEYCVAELGNRWFDVFAARVGGDGSRQIVLVYNNITERKRTEANLAFLAEVSEYLVRMTKPEETLEILGEKIGAHFNVARSMFVEILENEKRAIVRDWHRPNLSSIGGEISLAEFVTEAYHDKSRAGQTIVITDVQQSPLVDGRRIEDSFGVTSFIDVPIVRDGQWVFTLGIHDAAPRDWRNDEIKLLEELTARIWARLERARVEEDLRESESRLQSIANLVPDLLWDSESDGSTNWYNRRWLEYTGQSFEEAINWGWMDAIHPDDREASVQRYRKAVKKGEMLRQEHRIRRYDGEYRWFIVNSFPYKGESGKVIKIYGAATDIHESRLMNEALRESEELFRLVSDAVPSVIYDWNVQEDKITRSSELVNLLGFSPDDPQTQTNKWWKTRLHPDDAKTAVGKVIEKIKSNDYLFDDEYRVQHRDGHYVWVSDTGVLLRDENNTVIRWIGSATNITERKEAEELLAKSEEHFRAIVNQNLAGIFEIDLSGRIIFANEEFCRMIGYECEQLADLELKEYIHSEDLTESVKKLERMQKDKKPFDIEKRYIRKDGSIIWVHNSISPISNGDNKIHSAVIVSLDITERKKTEIRLREAEERTRITLEAAELATWEWNIETGEVFWNEQHFRLFGMKPRRKPVTTNDFFRHIQPDHREYVSEKLQKAVEQKIPFDVEFCAVRNDGGTRWMSGYGRVTETDADGKTTRMSGVMFDITERKNAAETLRKSEEHLQLILESTRDYAIITFDLKGIITRWNTGAERTFGYTETEMVGSKGDILFTPEDRAANIPAKEFETALKKGRAEDERWHLRKDGSRFYASGVMQPLRDGKLEGFVKIARDQTEKLNVETALREQEMLRQFVRTQEDERRRIARDLHDHLGQQMTAMRLKLERLKNANKNLPVYADIDEVQTIAEQLDRDVDFLAWELRPASLDDLGLRVTLANFVKQWSEYSGIAAEIHFVGLGKNRLDFEIETNLYRIAQEALNNVFKHAKAKNVSVLLEKRGKTILLIIEDNGIGFNLESKLNRQTGLGLTGMRERAKICGGTLEIESQKGQGTTIFARIPVKK